MSAKIFFALLFFVFGTVSSEVVSPPTLFLNAVVHQGNGESITNAALAIDNELISIIGDARTLRLELEKFTVLNMAGAHIYPIELIDSSNPTLFIKEYPNLISLHSRSDSVLTAKVIHEESNDPYFQTGISPSFVVINKSWNETRPVRIYYAVIRGKVFPIQPLKS